MKHLPRRSVLAGAGCGALAAALLLSACGKKEEPAATATAATAAAAPASAASGPLKVAFAYVGPVGDAGWTFAHDEGRKQAIAKFGDNSIVRHEDEMAGSHDCEPDRS